MNDIFKNVWWWNFQDNDWGVKGIALIKKDSRFPIHKHDVSEEYYLLWGYGQLFLNNSLHSFNAYSHVHIPAGIHHCYKSLSNYSILAYSFPKGPFNTIPYIFKAAL